MKYISNENRLFNKIGNLKDVVSMKHRDKAGANVVCTAMNRLTS